MWTFPAMNTQVSITAPSLDDAAEHQLASQIADLFDAVEQRFSRFRPDSELSRLNHATGAFVVSSELLEILLAARRHVTSTGGLFDPAIGGALAAAGYDRSFAPGALDRDAPEPVLPARFSDVEIDTRTRRVWRPAHVQLDLGGFLKGRTVDAAVALAPACVAVDAGGDAVLRGGGPDGDGWLVEIEDPDDPDPEGDPLATIRVRDRAVATSAPNRRRWRAGRQEAHHLIDARVSAPARSDLAQVTVVASTAEQADVLAKVTFVLGAAEGQRFLARRPGVGAILVGRDRRVRFLGDVEVADA